MSNNIRRPAALDLAYRAAYNRGWRISNNVTDGALERADCRGEPDAWYDGYHDDAAGRDKWHLAYCTNHDSPDLCVMTWEVEAAS